MLRISVIALSINNLTDARYFAALGVDWLGFNINPASESYINAEQLKEIIDWVEGPSMMVQDAQWNPQAQQLVNFSETSISGQLLQKEESPIKDAELLCFSKHDENATYRIFDSLEQWQSSGTKASEAYINYSGKIQDLEKQLSLENPPGLVLYGSEEQAAGVKSFEDLDDVFDLLYP